MCSDMKWLLTACRWSGYVLVGIVVLPVLLVIALVRGSGRVADVVRGLVDVVPCPDGHPNHVYGTWVCKSCGAKFRGYAFAPCPVCENVAAYFSCETCGLAIPGPFKE